MKCRHATKRCKSCHGRRSAKFGYNSGDGTNESMDVASLDGGRDVGGGMVVVGLIDRWMGH